MAKELHIGPGAWVELHYTIKNARGQVVDSTQGDSPVAFVWGTGAVVPGVEAALEGAAAGDVITVTVPPEDGYGERSERDLFAVDPSEFPDPSAVKVGDEFNAEGDDGAELTMRVVEVYEDHVMVDANHPLAGQTLEWVVRVLKVRPATEAERAG